MGENAARYLAKGRAVAVDGRLEWREWTTDNGDKRQRVEVVADTVQFLGGPVNDSPADDSAEPVAVATPSAAGDDEDIPF
jgi:single-strand DNA-binding protein